MTRQSFSVPRGLYAILDESLVTDGNWGGMARKLLAGGARVIQLRAKSLPAGDMLQAAKKVAAECKVYGAIFIVNDRADVALLSGADGVHVGQDDIPVRACRKVLGPKALIGVSTNSIEEAIEAVKAEPDYIGYGPIFTTESKQTSGNPRGVESLAEVVKAVAIPVVAIGGIMPDNVASVKKAGAHAAAVITALALHGDIEKGAREIIRVWEALK